MKMEALETYRRIVWLDALKGIGILLVIFSHTELKIADCQFITAGYIQLFFIAAGFTIRPNIKTSLLLKKKSSRLLVPYFVYGIFILSLFSIGG